jgi:flagellar biosynthetic protein FliP
MKRGGMASARAAALSLPILLAGASVLHAAEGGWLEGLPRILTGLDREQALVAVRGLVAVTVLSVVPSILLLATSYPRILIVLSFLRRALGTQDLPSQGILAGLSLILTGIVMMPVWMRVYTEAYLPLERGQIQTVDEAIAKASVPLKEFMSSHTLESDLRLMVELSTPDGKASPSQDSASTTSSSPRTAEPATVEDLSFFVVLPAFVLSELKTAFQIGFLLYLPFLVIDLAVSAVLVSMGMFLLPPAMVSLPIKILVFVLADGWDLVVAQLIEGFRSAL